MSAECDSVMQLEVKTFEVSAYIDEQGATTSGEMVAGACVLKIVSHTVL